MRDLFEVADYLAEEISAVLNLCEWIDQQHDVELAATQPKLHTQMRLHLVLLVNWINHWRDGQSGENSIIICEDCPHRSVH